ncbi:uncharacterized protein LOC123533291 [Mercenaria mercenaria]|uniref:uncharacterized protein LOC123533291 n=1 Tax=Mercenaria mercenaria TaxID=6596 RepID=UPI00234E3971|nr:uncharacterized protein LOC123533291 [Mercenaria mercenaria]
MEVSGRRGREKDFTPSFSRGSDDADQLYCLPCKQDGSRVPAFGYCQNCAEHLCETCYKVHTKPSPSRNHILLDRTQMPKTQDKGRLTSTQDLTETCQKHHGKVIEYFCKDHKTLGCSPCMTMDHRSCRIDYIPDVSWTYIASSQYQSLLQALQTLHENLKETNKSIKENKRLIQENQDKVKADIQQFRHEINTKLDKWEAEMYKEIERLVSREHQRIYSTLTQCQEMTRKIEAQQTSFKSLERDKKCNLMFIHGKKKEESIKGNSYSFLCASFCAADTFYGKLTNMTMISNKYIIKSVKRKNRIVLPGCIFWLVFIKKQKIMKMLKNRWQFQQQWVCSKQFFTKTSLVTYCFYLFIVFSTNFPIIYVNLKKFYERKKTIGILFKADKKIEQTLKQECKANSYIFQPNFAIKNLLKTETTLGTLLNTSEESKHNKLQDQEAGNKTTLSAHFQLRPRHHENVSSSDIIVTLLDQINLKTVGDQFDRDIGGLAVIDTSRLAVVDYSNVSINIVDVKQKTTVSELKLLTSNPWDVTLLPGDQLAVTLPYSSLIQILSFSNGLSKVRQLTANHWCYGLAFIEGSLIVGMADGKVKIMNLSGKVLKTMDCGVADDVSYVTACSNYRYIYASCGSSVIRFSMSGETIGRYTHGSLKKPRGLAVLEDGSILVCDHGNSSIHQISENMESSRMILQETNECMKPYCMALDSEEKKLYIGSGNECNFINVYSLK